MLVWLLMLGAIVVLWFVIPEGLGEKKKKLIFLTLSGLLVAFLMGSRCPIRTGSGDVYVYYTTYMRLATQSVEYVHQRITMEESYLYINQFLVGIIPWGQFIIYLEAAFTTFAVFRFIYRNSEDVFLGVVVYITTGAWAFFTSGFRQAFAICICLFAFEQMKKKKLRNDLAALLIIMFATLFHVTAWAFLLAYIIRSLKPNKTTVTFTFVITAVCFFALDYIVDIFEVLMENEFETGYEGSVFGGLIPIATFVLALLFSYMAWRQDKAYTEKYGFHVMMLLVGLCLYLFRYNTMVFERISYYFTVVICAVLPNSLCAIKDPRTKTVCKALCVAFCVLLFWDRMSDMKDYYFYWME